MKLPKATQRLVFRAWRLEDLPLAEALWGDARVTALIGGPFEPARIMAMLQQQLDFAQRCGAQYFPIFLRSDGAHVGCCGLRPRQADDAPLELGFQLRPEHWGQGLAQEAALAAIAHAFEVLKAPALFAGHHPDNTGSSRLLKKLGFSHTHDELYPPTGRMHPSYLLNRR